MALPEKEDTIQLVKTIFTTYLKEKNQRQTPERFMVLEEVYSSEGHLDAEELFSRLKNSGTRVSRATVYNTLDLLIECGLVQRHQFGQNQYVYERAYAYRQHDHLICKECNAVMEFCDPRIMEIQNLMEKIYDFKVDSHSLHLFGRCIDPDRCERKAAMEANKV
ncbi:MAG: transcriptional repressor [Bacteroidetes bacterium]|jgi:Fur family ferric uptake transcriptional regulator|nr:transcriptional repressor [Bacteroidota bacterium]PTM15416.1 MAG: transcriptional repressor [Bacteroidota bacterium]PTM21053.1 MAG: transcriptional repressor [Bacteroidota bacterium]